MCMAGPDPTTVPSAHTDGSVIFTRKIEDGRQLVVTRRPVPLEALPELGERSGPGPGRPRPPTRLSQVSVNLVTAQGVSVPLHARLVREFEDIGHVGFEILEVRLDPGGVLLVLANEPEGALTLTAVLLSGWAAPRVHVYPLSVGEIRPEQAWVGPIDLAVLRAKIVGRHGEGLGIEVDDSALKRVTVFRVGPVTGGSQPVWNRSSPPS